MFDAKSLVDVYFAQQSQGVPMHIAYFTEEPLHTYPVEEARARGDSATR